MPDRGNTESPEPDQPVGNHRHDEPLEDLEPVDAQEPIPAQPMSTTLLVILGLAGAIVGIVGIFLLVSSLLG